MALAAPLMLLTEGRFPVNDLAVRASVIAETHAVDGTIGTSVGTPVGRLPVNGKVAAIYACDGTFTGTVRYSFLVRLGARLKGVGLVTALDGQLAPSAVSQCALTVESLSGQFRVADSTIAGYVRSGADSLAISGTLRAFGDTAYQATVAPAHYTDTASTIITFHVR